MSPARVAIGVAAALVLPVTSATASPSATTTHTILTRTATSVSRPSSTSGCPDAGACALYSLRAGRWPAWQGISTIAYSINPLQPWMAPDDAERAILTAAAVWNRVDPVVRLVALGRTVRIPATGDRHNDVGWGRLDPGVLASTTITTTGKRIVEADVVFNLTMPWAWSFCSQRSNSCGAAPLDGGMFARFQIQATATHEFGHWLGLADLTSPAAEQLTMYGSVMPGDRRQATLGLGDVKGVRAAYPCRPSKTPPIYRP